MRFAELRFKLFIRRCSNVEYGESASDVKEQSPESKLSSWTHPINDKKPSE